MQMAGHITDVWGLDDDVTWDGDTVISGRVDIIVSITAIWQPDFDPLTNTGNVVINGDQLLGLFL